MKKDNEVAHVATITARTDEKTLYQETGVFGRDIEVDLHLLSSEKEIQFEVRLHEEVVGEDSETVFQEAEKKVPEWAARWEEDWNPEKYDQ